MYQDLVARAKDRDELDARLGDTAAAERIQQARRDLIAAGGGLED